MIGINIKNMDYILKIMNQNQMNSLLFKFIKEKLDGKSRDSKILGSWASKNRNQSQLKDWKTFEYTGNVSTDHSSPIKR